jgi:hypothetical protein
MHNMVRLRSTAAVLSSRTDEKLTLRDTMVPIISGPQLHKSKSAVLKLIRRCHDTCFPHVFEKVEH